MKKVLLSLLVFFMLGLGAKAQIISGMTAAKVDDLRSSEIVIINGTGQNIFFYLSCDGENWERVDIPANKLGEFDCNYQSHAYIRIVTDGGGKVEYKLHNYDVYEFFFNRSRQLFDIQKR